MDITKLNLGQFDNNYALHNNLLSSVSTPRYTSHIPSVITNEITPPVRCSNQKSSGRCWIFAALNMLRRPLITEKKLPDNQFVRVHRSFIIRTDKIAQIEQPNIILENDKRIIPVGGSYKETLVKKLNLI